MGDQLEGVAILVTLLDRLSASSSRVVRDTLSESRALQSVFSDDREPTVKEREELLEILAGHLKWTPPDWEPTERTLEVEHAIDEVVRLWPIQR